MHVVAQLLHFFGYAVALDGVNAAHNHKLRGNVGNKDKQANYASTNKN